VINRNFMLATTMFVAAASPAFATVAAPAPAKKAATPATGQKETTRAQFMTGIQNRFNAVDTNHDGFLDANEVNAMQQKEIQQAKAVEQQKLDAEFTKLDTNKDGQLSKAEFMAAAPNVQARVTPQQIIGQIDANKDGKISVQEYEAGPLSTFNKVDANHAGTITQAEDPAARTPKKK
jgi:Ca2+-binding EF-hand superfamily protein